MKLPNIIRTAALSGLAAAGVSYCLETGDYPKINPVGSASLELGQVVKGSNRILEQGLVNAWMRTVYCDIGILADLSAQTQASLVAGAKVYNEFPARDRPSSTRKLNCEPFVDRAEVRHSFPACHSLTVTIRGGIFPFKYDGNARNLGEYLFRSGTYPQYLVTEFDWPWARLTGVDVNARIGNLNSDLLAYFNTEWAAVNDLDLALLASWHPGAVEVGAGATVNSLASADENLTTPQAPETRYKIGNYLYHYSFRGIKLMARFALDPKTIINARGLGAQDLIIYGEAALLGAENFPRGFDTLLSYDRPLERIPAMVGFNVPTFKLLDVLSVEVEWFGSRYPNSLERIVLDNVPVPYQSGTTAADLAPYARDDNWKWSVHAEKTICGRYRVAGQAASDHLRTYGLVESTQDWEEICRSPRQWYWMLKIGVMI